MVFLTSNRTLSYQHQQNLYLEVVELHTLLKTPLLVCITLQYYAFRNTSYEFDKTINCLAKLFLIDYVIYCSFEMKLLCLWHDINIDHMAFLS